MMYEILWHGDRYELWVDNHFVDDFRTYIEALNVADRMGATKRPKRIEPDESEAPLF